MKVFLLSLYWVLSLLIFFSLLRLFGVSPGESLYLSPVFLSASFLFKFCLTKKRRLLSWRTLYAVIGICICLLLSMVVFYYFRSQVNYPNISYEKPSASVFIIFSVISLALGYGNYLLHIVLNRFFPTSLREITFVSQRQPVTLNITDLIFIESHDNEVWLYTRDGNHYKNRTPISHWENLLGEQFLRIHRAYLVSLDAVTHATDDKVFVGSISLPVSQKYREDVKKVLLAGNLYLTDGKKHRCPYNSPEV